MYHESKLSPNYTSATPQEDNWHCLYFSFKNDLGKKKKKKRVNPSAVNWTSAELMLKRNSNKTFQHFTQTLYSLPILKTHAAAHGLLFMLLFHACLVTLEWGTCSTHLIDTRFCSLSVKHQTHYEFPANKAGLGCFWLCLRSTNASLLASMVFIQKILFWNTVAIIFPPADRMWAKLVWGKMALKWSRTIQQKEFAPEEKCTWE